MSEKNDYGFCPRCGALMQDGVCKSCGFGRSMGPGVQITTGSNVSAVEVGRKPKKNWALGLAITGGVLLLFALIGSAVFFLVTVSKEAKNRDTGGDQGNYGDDYYDDNYDDYDSGYYKADPSDPYYEDLTDSISEDYNYHVIWYSDSIDPADSENRREFYSTYPMLEGENQELLDGINEKIRDTALKYKKDYRDYAGGCSSYGYVTYMDAEKCSIVLRHSLWGDSATESVLRLDALNFDMTTGELIPYEAMMEFDESVALHFRSQDKIQNGGVDYVQKLSDGEIMEALRDPATGILFYTPVGIEAGINYDGGWVTVTYKDKAL